MKESGNQKVQGLRISRGTFFFTLLGLIAALTPVIFYFYVLPGFEKLACPTPQELKRVLGEAISPPYEVKEVRLLKVGGKFLRFCEALLVKEGEVSFFYFNPGIPALGVLGEMLVLDPLHPERSKNLTKERKPKP